MLLRDFDVLLKLIVISGVISKQLIILHMQKLIKFVCWSFSVPGPEISARKRKQFRIGGEETSTYVTNRTT